MLTLAGGRQYLRDAPLEHVQQRLTPSDVEPLRCAYEGVTTLGAHGAGLPAYNPQPTIDTYKPTSGNANASRALVGRSCGIKLATSGLDPEGVAWSFERKFDAACAAGPSRAPQQHEEQQTRARDAACAAVRNLVLTGKSRLSVPDAVKDPTPFSFPRNESASGRYRTTRTVALGAYRTAGSAATSKSVHAASAVLPEPTLQLAIVLPVPASCACKDGAGRCDCLSNHVVRHTLFERAAIGSELYSPLGLKCTGRRLSMGRGRLSLLGRARRNDELGLVPFPLGK